MMGKLFSAADAVLAIKKETKNRHWVEKLSEFPTVKTVLEESRENQRLVLIESIKYLQKLKRKNYSSYPYSISDLVQRLLQRKLPLTESDLHVILKWINCGTYWNRPIGYVVKSCERYIGANSLTDRLQSDLRQLLDSISSKHTDAADRKLLRRISILLGEEPEEHIHLDTTEPWAKRLLEDLEQLAEPHAAPMGQLVLHAASAVGSKPSAKWLKQTESLTASVDDKLLHASLTVWINAFDKPREETPGEYTDIWSVASVNAEMMKGLIWIASLFTNDDLIRAVASAGLSGQRKIPGIGPRSAKVSNAAVWTLGAIDSELAIGQLSILRAKIRNKATQKVIDKAIAAVAERMQIPLDEVEEIAVPTFGLSEVGRRVVPLGDFSAEIVVTGTTTVELRWFKPDGKQQKSVPKSVKDNFGNELKELRAVIKDIRKIVPAQRNRIDLLHLKQKSWPFRVWAERYLEHPLIGTLARRLIWVLESNSTDDKQSRLEVTWLDGQLVDASGTPVEFDAAKTIVSLWHPIGSQQEEIIAWRRFFEEREIRQPFKQAHREIYLLTDAERNTRVYSNRYASHVIKQHQYNALCAIRGWTNTLRLCVDDEYPATFIDLPEWNLRAEFWVEGIGQNYGTDTNESGVYFYLATDQVRFYPIDAVQLIAHAGGGGYGWHSYLSATEPDPIPLEQIPPLVLSEVMRDIDLFVGVASVGNDPNWQDGGPEGNHYDYWHNYSFGDLSVTAKTRREILKRLIPRLKIADRCSFDDRFLIVRGDLRTYRIHLGSSNILMDPNDQYLCIVPGRGAGQGDKVFLPFEGDQRFAVILSKAIMLADDRKIKDATIISQIQSKAKR